jgi:hypothetical protein
VPHPRRERLDKLDVVHLGTDTDAVICGPPFVHQSLDLTPPTLDVGRSHVFVKMKPSAGTALLPFPVNVLLAVTFTIAVNVNVPTTVAHKLMTAPTESPD